MKRRLAVLAMCLLVSCAIVAQEKETERLDNSAKVMKELLSGDKGLPKHILDQADCVLIYPSVKKVAFGIGTSYGRGALVCRKGATMNGEWGSPIMYSLDQGSLGLQLGSSATDFVVVVMNKKGAEQILSGKTKLGSNAAAAAGPTGAQATSYNAEAMQKDILTYSRSKGMFAGISMEGATMDIDSDANKAIYGKDMTAKEIMASQPAVPAAKPLVTLLDNTSPARK